MLTWLIVIQGVSDDILSGVQVNNQLSRSFQFLMDTYRNFINGKWVESTLVANVVNNINPANTDDVIGTVKQATREEARSAVEAAADSVSRLARNTCACARKNRRARRASVGRTQGRAGANPDSRRRQDTGRVARRVATLDQRGGVLRGRVAPHERRDNSI